MEIEAMNARSISSRLPLQVKLLAVSVAALVLATGLNLLIDAGALAHDITCPTHGWINR